MTHPPRRLLLLGAGPVPDGGSLHAPGVANRLLHFLLPALKAGHEALVLTIEPDATALDRDEPRPEERSRGALRWRHLALTVEDLKSHPAIPSLVAAWAPERVVGAGTLQAAARACALAADAPVWADFFGDPLAEIHARNEFLPPGPERLDSTLLVWELMLRTLLRADAFSVVSRRQRDALLGQLALAGRLATAPEARHPAGPPIEPMPCCLESLDDRPPPSADERARAFASAGLPPAARVALWSGGFNAWADPATLVAGIERAMARRPDLHLVATGGALPGYLARPFELFRERVDASPHRDRFHALGWLPLAEANRWLALADVALLTDRPCAETHLGARNRLLYHAAVGCPVVASTGSEVVAEMAAAGALAPFPSANPDALAGEVLRLLENDAERRRLGEAGRQFCRRQYLFEHTCAGFLDWVARASPAAPPAPDPSDPRQWIARYLTAWAQPGEADGGARRPRLLGRLLARLRAPNPRSPAEPPSHP